MALILGVNKNSRFFVDGTEVKVLETEGFTKITLLCQGQTYVVTDESRVEIFPQVWASVGLPSREKTMDGVAMLTRLVIDAPRNITILRSGLYQKSKYGARSGESER